jgi:hypothetical protein
MSNRCELRVALTASLAGAQTVRVSSQIRERPRLDLATSFCRALAGCKVRSGKRARVRGGRAAQRLRAQA